VSIGITGNLGKDAALGRAGLENRQDNAEQIRQKNPTAQNDLVKPVLNKNSAARFAVSEDSIRLAARLQASAGDGQLILFTGTHEKDGVSTVATQVALALVQSGVRPVLLIDANMYVPSIHKVFNLAPEPGLAQLLKGTVPAGGAVRDLSGDDLWVLPAGGRIKDSASLFSSAAFSEFFAAIRKQFRFVVVSSPPILDHAESVVIAGRSDGVVMVLAAGSRTRADLRRIKDELDGVKAHLLGAVLSRK
jgi:capsular exopolysaccharide synthesis family protein